MRNFDCFVGTSNILVVHLESVQKFEQDLVLCFLSLNDVGVLFSIVSSPDIADIKNSAAVFVHNFEGFHCNCSSEIIHFASDSEKELLIVNRTTLVIVEDFEESFDFSIS